MKTTPLFPVSVPPITKKRRSYRFDITPERFVSAWATCKSVKEVAHKLNTTKKVVMTRFYNYKKRGVKLEMFEPPKPKNARVDVPALNKLYADLCKKKAK